MHNFLIANNVDFEQMCEDFILEKFGDNNDITYDVSYYDEFLGTPNYRLSIFVQIIFDSYKWTNKLGNEMPETVGIEFDDKGIQPFYIDGKFITKEVYEAVSWCYPQQHDIIYGFEKEELKNMFYDFMTTC